MSGGIWSIDNQAPKVLVSMTSNLPQFLSHFFTEQVANAMLVFALLSTARTHFLLSLIFLCWGPAFSSLLVILTSLRRKVRIVRTLWELRVTKTCSHDHFIEARALPPVCLKSGIVRVMTCQFESTSLADAGARSRSLIRADHLISDVNL